MDKELAKIFIKKEPVRPQLSNEERMRFFNYCVSEAYDHGLIAVQMAKNSLPIGILIEHSNKMMSYLEAARDVYPLTKDGETISVQDIVNGKY